MKKVLVIKNSPRKNSNSELLVDSCFKAINEHNNVKIKTVFPHKLDIGPCMSCFACYKNGRCKFKDDMQELYQIFNTSEIVLVSTPVFFNGIPSHLKAMIDRCQAIWSGKYMANSSLIDRNKKRYGYLFATGGAPEYDEQFTASRLVISMFFRVINTEFSGSLFVPDVDKKPVKDRQEIQREAYQIGIEIVNDILS